MLRKCYRFESLCKNAIYRVWYAIQNNCVKNWYTATTLYCTNFNFILEGPHLIHIIYYYLCSSVQLYETKH